MFLGIDLGTSALKVVLIDMGGEVLAQADAPLDVDRPHSGWAEQDPETWWGALASAMERLRRSVARSSAGSSTESARLDGLAGLEAIGLSGQMHGATLLDADDRPLRPAILWNDGRSSAQCAELEEAEPSARVITGNLAMPGFTAPKLLWVRKREPDVFRRTTRVLLPKDYLRLRLTGERATDVSDASGTLWLDVGRRRWSEAMLAACGLSEQHMPALFESPEVTGRLRREVADAWGCARVPVVAGAGDQAAGALGVGVLRPGQASLSLGTSGVYFVAGDRFTPNPKSAVHAFCHALPNTWHQMSVLLSAAGCLTWVTRLTGAASEAALLDEVERRIEDLLSREHSPLFLPYLSGERTPHNDPFARGVLHGLDHDTDRAALGLAVLEGVAFAFADAQDALLASGSSIEEVALIGGGARSELWGRILASVLERPLERRTGGALGPALGAARLACLGVTGAAPAAVCPKPPLEAVIEPEPRWTERLSLGLPRFRRLYRDLRASFPDA